MSKIESAMDPLLRIQRHKNQQVLFITALVLILAGVLPLIKTGGIGTSLSLEGLGLSLSFDVGYLLLALIGISAVAMTVAICLAGNKIERLQRKLDQQTNPSSGTVLTSAPKLPSIAEEEPQVFPDFSKWSPLPITDLLACIDKIEQEKIERENRDFDVVISTEALQAEHPLSEPLPQGLGHVAARGQQTELMYLLSSLPAIKRYLASHYPNKKFEHLTVAEVKSTVLDLESKERDVKYMAFKQLDAAVRGVLLSYEMHHEISTVLLNGCMRAFLQVIKLDERELNRWDRMLENLLEPKDRRGECSENLDRANLEDQSSILSYLDYLKLRYVDTHPATTEVTSPLVVNHPSYQLRRDSPSSTAGTAPVSTKHRPK